MPELDVRWFVIPVSAHLDEIVCDNAQITPEYGGLHGGIYSHMTLSETLWKHLAEIDEECNEMMDRLVGQMAKNEGVTERLKSDDWLCWLQKMNGIRSRAEEVVLHDLIYSL